LIGETSIAAYENHARIISWNQLVLNNEGFLLKEKTEAFDWLLHVYREKQPQN